MRYRIILAALVLGLATDPAPADGLAAPAAAVELARADGSAIRLDAASLGRLPSVEQDVTFETAKGPSSGHYRGVLVWDVLRENGALDGSGHHGELRQAFSVTGADGYRIVFSVGEIAPDFGNRAVMLASEVDGKALALPRLVVPGDRLGARNVRDVTRIEVK